MSLRTVFPGSQEGSIVPLQWIRLMPSVMSAWDFCRAFSFLDMLVSPSDLSLMKGESKSEFSNQLQRPIVLVPAFPSFLMTALGPRREYRVPSARVRDLS